MTPGDSTAEFFDVPADLSLEAIFALRKQSMESLMLGTKAMTLHSPYKRVRT